MQLSGKLTDEDLTDVRHLARSKTYWLKIAARNWYGILLLCAVAWGTVAGLTGETHPNWAAVAGIWLVLIALSAWSFYRTKRTMHKQFIQANASLPDSITILKDGLRLDGPNGATSFQPWSNFTQCREGKRVMLLQTRYGGALILPVAKLSEMERESIRQIVTPHVSAASTRPAQNF